MPADYRQIRRIPVQSSNVSSIGWAQDTLVVVFKDGSIYRYLDVPEEVWLAFKEARSKGKFVWAELRGVYEYDRVQ